MPSICTTSDSTRNARSRIQESARSHEYLSAQAREDQGVRAQFSFHEKKTGNPQSSQPTANERAPSYLAQAAHVFAASGHGQHEVYQGSHMTLHPGNIESKKGSVVEHYFTDRKFSGAPSQSVHNLIRDFEICSHKQGLIPLQMSLFCINALADPVRQHFLTHCSSTMPFEQIVTIMRRHYNSGNRKLQLQSEIDSLELLFCVRKHQTDDASKGLTELVDHINALAPQLPAGFADEPHKTRYFRCAVKRFD